MGRAVAPFRWFVVLALALGAAACWAQEDDLDDIGTAFRKPSAAEEHRLRQILARPVPPYSNLNSPNKSAPWGSAVSDTLERHFQAKYVAARLLGDDAQREVVVREAVRLVPKAHWKNKLGSIMLAKGLFDEGNALNRKAADEADPYIGASISAQIACDLVDQNKADAARAAIAEVAVKVKAAERDAKTNSSREFLSRAAAVSALCLSSLEQRLGRYALAIQAADAAVQSSRKGLALRETLNGSQRLNSIITVARTLRGRVGAYHAAGRLHDAEKALAEYLRFSTEVQLPANYLAGVYSMAGTLRFAQREFVLSERLKRKADAVLEGLALPPTHPSRAAYAHDIFIALAGQKKWADALAEVERLDKLAGDDAKLKNLVSFPLDRGTVYFGNRRYADAAPWFARAATERRQRYGATHFFAAQATGLHGAALWHSGGAENRARALPLLKASVRDYMAPANADFLENFGIRRENREIVFAAYLEAMASSPGEDATQAIGAADWVRGGSVQEALGDAAVRAAAGTPALADVVRREQDARNEVAGLRRYLEGDTGSASSPLPVIAAQMRARIAVLEEERAKLQAEIKAKFPDYERLVRPTPPTAQDIARALDPQQALLMLLPTPDAVYVWAVAADRAPAFRRVALTEAQLGTLVGRLRGQLDFGNGTRAGREYDSAAAFELYDKLLAPLASVWQGKPQLIVAAGGTLSQLPFAVLHTRAGGGLDAGAPWLIRDASITQVPSLSAWLAIKSIAKAQSAAQPFAGWGDPRFGPSTLAATLAVATPSRSIGLTRAAVLADLENPDKTPRALSALVYSRIPALPDTRDELLAIAATLQADPQQDVLLGAAATRDSVLAASRSGQLANKRVVAFATHGLMAGDLPNLTQPALAMAATGAEAQDPLAPLLTLEDVLTLKLNADWVVLSACNTAAADGRAEEALSGLARGFFYAGSRSLLVTHWAVDSESAKELTTSTFAHYVANPTAPKAESLRQAMLKVMAMPQFSHPAYWAPYALVGDGGR